MVGNDCGSVKISFMATFFLFSYNKRQKWRKDSVTLLSDVNFSECLQVPTFYKDDIDLNELDAFHMCFL